MGKAVHTGRPAQIKGMKVFSGIAIKKVWLEYVGIDRNILTEAYNICGGQVVCAMFI